MAAVSDCFSIGSIVACTTCFHKNVEGEVLAFDSVTKMLILSILLQKQNLTKQPLKKGRRCAPPFDCLVLLLSLSLLSLLLRRPLAPPPLLQPKKRLHPRTLAHFHVYMDRWIGASTHYTHIQMNAMISNDNNNSKDDDTTNQHKLH